MVILKYFSLILIFVSTLFAQAIEVEATTDSSEYFVGDFIHYNVKVTRNKNVNFEMPSVQDSVTTLEFIEDLGVNEFETDDKLITEFKFIFAGYDSTEITIPSFFIPYKIGDDSTRQLTATNEVYLVVKTLQVNPDEDIRDIKAPLTIPMDWLFFLFVTIGLMILALAGYFVYRFYQKRKLLKIGEVPAVVIPPYEEAIQSLKKLEEDQLWQQGLIKEYHSEITHIVRKYFERKFSFLALEMPSSEVLDQLKKVTEAESVLDLTRNFLSNADMVKFAKFVPMASVNEEMLQQAYEIVNNTKPEPVIEENLDAEVENV